ncbi:hypothetical protein [Nigerium sp.]|uniref:hypothetical protein n=1 Tax=Nigerium sp. TaxID=2042655 RepID=UPI0032217E78
MSSDGPVEEIRDLITGEAADRGDQQILDRIRADHERKQEADAAAAEASEPVSGSVNEPDPGLTMRDLADQAEADGRAQKPSKEDADDDL